MKNKKTVLSLMSLMLLTTLVTGCGQKTELKDGEQIAVKIKGSEITADEYYEKIKSNNVSQLIDMIDHDILDKKYGDTDEEKKKIKEQMDNIEKQYGSDERIMDQLLRQFGVKDKKELKEVLKLEYRRTEAVNDYIEKHIKEKEIEKYYKENIYGEVRASHILIQPSVSEDATQDEIEEAEKEAKKKAEKVINELKDGKKFEDLAKKYSDDKSNSSNGGDLGYFDLKEMVPEFSDAVKDLEKGKYTTKPVKSEFGYHIILKKDQKAKPKLKNVKKDIIETLRNKKLEDDPTLYYQTLIDIRKSKKIEFKDDEIKEQYEDLMDQLIESAKPQEQPQQ